MHLKRFGVFKKWPMSDRVYWLLQIYISLSIHRSLIDLWSLRAFFLKKKKKKIVYAVQLYPEQLRITIWVRNNNGIQDRKQSPFLVCFFSKRGQSQHFHWVQEEDFSAFIVK